MTWKAHLHENSGFNTSNPLNYIFKSRKCPPQHKDLIQFENDLLELLTDNISKTCKKRSIIYITRSIKKLKLMQITMEFQKELIALQNQS